MNRDDLDSLDKEALIRLVLAQTDTIAALTRQVEMLTARLSRLETDNASLRAENVALREELKLPPKTPDNSSKRSHLAIRLRSGKARGGARRIPGRIVPCIRIRQKSR